MSVSGLKAELKFLESIFDPNHERFRIIDWKPDELSCQFNVTGEKLLIIHCNITVSPRPALRTKLAPAADYRLKALGGRFRVYNMNANFVFGVFSVRAPRLNAGAHQATPRIQENNTRTVCNFTL